LIITTICLILQLDNWLTYLLDRHNVREAISARHCGAGKRSNRYVHRSQSTPSCIEWITDVVFVGVAAQNNPCSGDTITINSNADLKNFATCSTLTGNVVIGENSDTSMDFTTLSSLTKIDGDFSVLNNRELSSLKAPFSSITGDLHLQNLTKLSTLSMPSLKSVGSIKFISLTALGSLTFTTGVTTAKSVVVSDTFLNSLDGLDMVSCASMDINNNKFLTQWDSKLGNLTDNLNINANGLNFKASFPNMIWISNMTISNVSSFDVPSLSVVNGSMRFDSNFFESFSAPNLTDTDSGDISFISNSKLTNISMPSLTSIGGGFLIANNHNLHTVNGFPQLKSVGGAAKFRGNFSEYVDISCQP